MMKVEELETAVDSLPEREYRRFRRWFLEKDWIKWEREIEDDSHAGRLDFFIEEAREAKKTSGLGEF